MSSENPPHRLSLGIGMTLVAFLFMAIASAFVWSFQGRFPTIQIIFIQNVVSFFCILPLALRHGWERLKTDFLHIHFIRDLFGVGSYHLFFLAIRYLNLIDATTLNYTAPFFVPFVWWFWMHEKIEHSVWWTIILGFIGVVVVLNPSKGIFQPGFFFGLFAGVSSAVALVSLRILNLKREPLTRTLFYYFSVGSLLSFPFAWASWVPPEGKEWLLASGVGLTTAIGQVLLTIAYRHGTASFLSPLGYSVVIYAGLISYFIFQKPLGWHSIIGTLLIVLGGTFTYVIKKRPRTLKETFEPPKPKNIPPL